MLKNKSYFKSSTGDEAGAAAEEGRCFEHEPRKVYFTAWSMDVKIEGENAVRHLDMTTHNHGSAQNTGPMIFQDRMALLECVLELRGGEAGDRRRMRRSARRTGPVPGRVDRR